jgi:hypothetical protein
VRHFAIRAARPASQSRSEPKEEPSEFEFIAGGVTDVKDIDRVIADREDDPISVPSLAVFAVEQLAGFFGEFAVLRGQWAAARVTAERV